MNFPSHKGSVADSRHYLGCHRLKLPGIGRTQRPRRRVETVSGYGALSEDAPLTRLASPSLHGGIFTCPGVRSRARMYCCPISDLFIAALRGDFGSVPDSFMTTLNALLMLTFLELFPNFQRDHRLMRVPGGRVFSIVS